MKKILFATTALVGTLMAVGTASAAEPIKLAVGGQMKQWFGVVNQHGANLADQFGGTAGGGKFNKTGLDTQANVLFSGETKTNNGLVVTARIQLDTPANFATTLASVATRESSVALAGGLGTLRAGIKEVANQTMHSEAPDVGITYGGVSNWFAPPSGWASMAPYANAAGRNIGLLNSNLWSATSFMAFTDKQPSVSYISPSFHGLSLGASFVPGSGSIGPVDTLNTPHNVWETTLAYAREFAPVTLNLDAGYARGSGPKRGAIAFATPASYFGQSFRAWEGGAKIVIGGWTLGGAYLGLEEDKVDNPAAVTQTGTAVISTTGHAWNAGLSYINGPWGASLSYYNEKHRGFVGNTAGQEEFGTGMLSGSYELGPGITSRSTAFVARYAGLDESSANKNQGYGLVTGIDLAF
ncbi:MAG: porin [Alphaproteobacteria bacterium]